MVGFSVCRNTKNLNNVKGFGSKRKKHYLCSRILKLATTKVWKKFKLHKTLFTSIYRHMT